MELSLLNSPFPSPVGDRKDIFTALLTGIFVGGFLAIFKPFGLAEAPNYNLIKILGFGVVTFICLLLMYFVLPKLFPNFYDESKYTLGKDFITSFLTVIIIGTGNSFYLSFWAEIGFTDALGMIWNTFLVGIFPLTFLTLIQYNKLQRLHINDSKEINQATINKVAEQPAELESKVQIKTEKALIEIEAHQLFFVESVGNYANVVHVTDGKLNRNLYRTTLKSIEEGNQIDGLVRCHRSYIINLKQVKEVTGNAQGLQLTLKDCDEIVPVSRKYVSSIKSYFA